MRTSWKCVSWGQALHFGYSPFSENKAQNIKKKKSHCYRCACLAASAVYVQLRDSEQVSQVLLRILVELYACPTKAAFTENDGSEQAPHLAQQPGQVLHCSGHSSHRYRASSVLHCHVAQERFSLIPQGELGCGEDVLGWLSHKACTLTAVN